MKNKKGFTIVELLAVIVLLAAIMILVYPNVLEKIREQEKGIDQKTEKMLYQATYDFLYDNRSSYLLNTGEKYCVKISAISSDDYLIVDVDKKLLNTGYVQVQIGENGDVHQDENAYRIITNESLCQGTVIKVGVSNEDITSSEIVYSDGKEIYFNPVTGSSCNNYVDTNSNTGVKTGCMKWYAYGDTAENSTVKLLLDHNTTTFVDWSSTSTNKTNGDSVFGQLQKDTSNWTVDVDLIDAYDVAKLVGYTTWTANSDWFYFESNSRDVPACTKGKYSWIYDRTSDYCEEFGCSNNSDVELEGYWTKTAHSTDTGVAWAVYYDCGELLDSAVQGASLGVRPVITVSKSALQ